MKKIILTVISVSILFGCNSAPPLATPKGHLIEINTNITALLPHTQLAFIDYKKSNLLPPLKGWKIKKGDTLKKGFTEWINKEKCPVGVGKWTLQWESETDYPIDYVLSFRSSHFEDATSQLFSLYRQAENPLFVKGYRHQCLIVIVVVN